MSALAGRWTELGPRRWFLLAAVVAAVVEALGGLAVPLLIKVAVDDVFLPGDADLLAAVAGGGLALVLVRFAAGWAGAVAGTRVRPRIGPLTDELPRLAGTLVVLLGVGLVLALLDGPLALALLAVVPVLAVALFWFREAAATAGRAARDSAADSATAWQELAAATAEPAAATADPAAATADPAVTGATEPARAARAAEPAAAGAARAAWAAARAAEAAARLRTVTIGARFVPGLDVIAATAAVVVVVYGGQRVLAGELEIGSLIAFLLYLRVAFGPVFGLPALYDAVRAGWRGALPAVTTRSIPAPDPSGSAAQER